MELTLVIYISIILVLLLFLVFIVTSYLLSKIRDRNNSYQTNDIRKKYLGYGKTTIKHHLSKRKYFRTSFADTLELKKTRSRKIKKRKKLKTITNQTLSKSRMTRVNNLMKTKEDQLESILNGSKDFNFKNAKKKKS